tara:strand:+ start:714 stop:1142 length:429 start_codon:yes stop_codon:yes gene_type:complete
MVKAFLGGFFIGWREALCLRKIPGWLLLAPSVTRSRRTAAPIAVLSRRVVPPVSVRPRGPASAVTIWAGRSASARSLAVTVSAALFEDIFAGLCSLSLVEDAVAVLVKFRDQFYALATVTSTAATPATPVRRPGRTPSCFRR